MAKRFFTVFSITLAVITVAVALFAAFPSKNTVPEQIFDERRHIVTVADRNASPDSSRVLESRFLNMLNHNFVYDESFYTVEDIVNDSVIALLDMKEDEDSSFISEAIVKDYIFNMYGIEIDDFSEINPDFPKKEGYVFILHRGYSEFDHKMLSVNENEDGSYTVKTKVSVSSHDGIAITETCETLFVPNSDSSFGFVIIRSDIGAEATAV